MTLDRAKRLQLTGIAAAVPFVTHLRAQGFRSVARCNVSLGPLTVLIGPNASGKSNVLDILKFIQDCLTQHPADAVHKRGGPGDLFYRSGDVTANRLRVGARLSLAAHLGDSPEQSRYQAEYGFELIRSPEDDVQVSSEWCELSDETGDVRRGFRREADGIITDLDGNRTDGRIISGDLWLSNAAATDEILAGLDLALQNMGFYNLDPLHMAQPQPQTSGDALDHNGANLGDVLGALSRGFPEAKQRVDSYLGAIVPDAIGIDEQRLGRYTTVQLRMRNPKTGVVDRFENGQLSAGTLRAAGILSALFQPSGLTGSTPLICIDEPELGLHPSAAGVVFDALTEASSHVQVIVATQSGDLLDRDEFDPDWVRIVARRDGATVVGPIDAASRRILAEKLATPGALMRADQLVPDVPAGDE